MFSHLWNKLCGTSPHRRANRTTWGAIDGLESRELLAADLTLKNAFITLSELPNQPDKLWVNVQYTVYNAGTSGAELTGIPDNASDNVIVKVWASKNKTLDANDPLLAQNLNIYNDVGSHNLSQGAGVITAQAFAVTPNPDYDYLICEVDANHVLPESSESNNRVAIDAFKPQVSNFWETKTINKLQNSMFGSSSSACDLDSNGYYKMTVTVTGAQSLDRLKLIKSGVGTDALRIVGSKLKLGSQTLGDAIDEGGGPNSSTIKLTFQFFSNLSGISPELMNRLIKNLAFRAGAGSTGIRNVTIELMDNTSAVGSATRQLKIAS